MLTSSAILLVWPRRLSKRMPKSSSLLASILWVRAQDAQSSKEGPHARCDGDLSYGPHGRHGDDRKGPHPVRRFGRRLLRQFDGSGQGGVRRLRHVVQCRQDREEAAPEEHLLYAR